MANTGNIFPATGENVDRAGAGAWTNPGNIVSDNTTDATNTVASDYLVARNFGFTIPVGSTINGITVRVEASEHSGGTEDLFAQLQNDSGALIGNQKQVSLNGATKIVYTLGSTSDVWGASLTATIVNDPDFGVRLWYTTSQDVRIDYVTIAIEYTEASRRALVSWAELETPNGPRRAYVSFAEIETPNAPRRAQVSWGEIEVPTAPRRARVSFSELEVPSAPRRAFVSWAEFEAPDVDVTRRAYVSWAELETPDAPRRAYVSFAEIETPNAPRRAQVSFAELEAPNAPRRAQVSWSEFEVSNAPRRALVSWSELQAPDAPRAARVSYAVLEVPEVGAISSTLSRSVIGVRVGLW